MELKSHLRKQGYSGKNMERQLQRVYKLNREDLKMKGKRVLLVVTFSKQLPDISNIQETPGYHQIQLNFGLRLHNHRLWHIEKTQTYATHSSIWKPTEFWKKEKLCLCKVCEKIVMSEVTSATGEDAHKVETTARCTDRNIIYGIVCVKCDRAIYFGEMERTLKEQISEHMRDIKNSADKPINCHFQNHNEKDIVYAVLQRLGNENSKALRLLVEDIWIRKLKTLSPHGCNIQQNHWCVWLTFHSVPIWRYVLTRMESLEVCDVIHHRRYTACKMDVT